MPSILARSARVFGRVVATARNTAFDATMNADTLSSRLRWYRQAAQRLLGLGDLGRQDGRRDERRGPAADGDLLAVADQQAAALFQRNSGAVVH